MNLGTGTGLCNLVPTPDGAATYGATRLPVFRALTPAGEEQIHVGTSLGLVSARNNVGIHNSGDAAATARVELRRGCDDRLLSSATVQVAPNSTTQVRVEGAADVGCTAAHRDAQPWVESIRVVVDQLSLTWVSTLASGVEPRIFVTVR